MDVHPPGPLAYLDNIAFLEFPAAARLDLTVHADLSGLDQDLGLPARPDQAGGFQRPAQRRTRWDPQGVLPSAAGRVAHRHDQIQEVGLFAVPVLLGHDQPRLERFVELEDDVLRIYRGDPVEQVAGVEGDQELVLAVGLQPLVRVSDLPVAHDHLHGAFGEGEAHGDRRRLAGGEEVDPPQGADQLLPRDGDLPLESTRQEPPVLGEVAVYEPRAEDYVADPEQRLVLGERHLDVLFVRTGEDPGDLLHRPRRYDRLPRSFERSRRELRLLDAQAVGVGRDHPHARVLEADQDPRQHGPGLVPRVRARDFLHGLDERLPRHPEGALLREDGKLRIVVGRVSPNAVLVLPSHEPDRPLRGVVLQREAPAGLRPYYVVEDAGRYDHAPFSLDLSHRRRLDRDLHVRRR